jgi:sortase A
VPGSAGLGQPGNSVVVGRRNGFGAPFRALDRLRRGDMIVTTTTQGRSVYEVESVGSRVLGPRLFAPSDDDRLTLITSASASPLNRDRAMVVTAVMRDLPFAPTSQGALTRAATRIEAGGGSLAPLAIALATYVAVIVGSVVLYRRFRFPVAYVLSIAPIVAATVILGEQVMRLLPSWT